MGRKLMELNMLGNSILSIDYGISISRLHFMTKDTQMFAPRSDPGLAGRCLASFNTFNYRKKQHYTTWYRSLSEMAISSHSTIILDHNVKFASFPFHLLRDPWLSIVTSMILVTETMTPCWNEQPRYHIMLSNLVLVDILTELARYFPVTSESN